MKSQYSPIFVNTLRVSLPILGGIVYINIETRWENSLGTLIANQNQFIWEDFILCCLQESSIELLLIFTITIRSLIGLKTSIYCQLRSRLCWRHMTLGMPGNGYNELLTYKIRSITWKGSIYLKEKLTKSVVYSKGDKKIA